MTQYNFTIIFIIATYKFQSELKQIENGKIVGLAQVEYSFEKSQLLIKTSYSSEEEDIDEEEADNLLKYQLVHSNSLYLNYTKSLIGIEETNDEPLKNYTLPIVIELGNSIDGSIIVVNNTNYYVKIPDLFKGKYALQIVNHSRGGVAFGILQNTCGSLSPIQDYSITSWKLWFVLVTVLGMLIGLIFDLYRPYFVIFMALVFFLLSGVLTLKEALNGFSNDGLLAIAFLFPIVQPLSTNPILLKLSSIMFGKPWLTPRLSYLRMFLPIAILSSILNNTPIVVLFLPIIKDWCRANGLSPSKFLIPLSYFTVAGGLCTLIGTSTNLVVSGLMVNYGYRSFSFFEFIYIGGILLVATFIYMMTFGYSLLPNKKGGLFKYATERAENFLSQLTVTDPQSPLLRKNKTKLLEHLHLPKLEIIEVIRPQGRFEESAESLDDNMTEKIVPVPDDYIVQLGDKIFFKGSPKDIMALHSVTGLSDKFKDTSIFKVIGTEELRKSLDETTVNLDQNEVTEENTQEEGSQPQAGENSLTRFPVPKSQLKQALGQEESEPSNDPEYFEIVVGTSNPCCGQTYSEFSQFYQVALFAVRHRESIIKSTTDASDFSELKVQVGDTVLVLCKADFYEKHRESLEFFSISRCSVNPKIDHRPFIVKFRGREFNLWWWEYLIFPIFMAMIIGASAGIPMVICAMVAFGLMVILKLLSPTKAIASVDWELIILVACSLGVGTGIRNSGISEAFSELINAMNIPDIILPAIMFFITQTITQVITNNSAAATTLPLALALAQSRNLNSQMFGIIVAVASSSEFATPIGYQCNLIIQGPGGYGFLDYVKVGLPLNMIYFVLCSVFIPLIWGLREPNF